MNNLEHYVGQVLDEKYRLERLLGQGGMGAVYLATHLGTDRYVALKLIAPQFMQNQEFVERFKREARAAGRLRHPNVVDVTDFGFSGSEADRVAYLVMEYLDGCTLSDVLIEENRLPLYWVVDILEQVCSAVHEAHQQGIVHRDLKPDNIWLEPNGLGGYRVKVLDFGIAKLGEVSSALPLPRHIEPITTEEAPTLIPSPAGDSATVASTASKTQAASPELEAATLIQSPDDPNGFATPLADNDQATRMFGKGRETVVSPLTTIAPAADETGSLTRVGAILGTPLYMSPEQCRGERLDARSDIYSLGIIAYQMLTGAPPFTGDTSTIIRAHKENQAPPVRELNKKVPKRVSGVIMSTLVKDREQRPQTAMAFANAMRANADGLGALYRRAFSLYSEYFPKFLKLSFLAHIPVIIVTILALAYRFAEPRLGLGMKLSLGIPLALLQVVSSFISGSIISGVTAVIVTQLAVAPMKPVELRAAFAIMRRRWKPFLKTALNVIIRMAIGYILLVIPGIVVQVRYLLWGPVVLMEGLEGKAALKRARALASRSWRTIILAMLIQFCVPAIVGAAIGALIGFNQTAQHTHALRVKLTGQFAQLINIFVLPLLAIVPALLYLKMRQFGGETLNDVTSQLEELDSAKSLWQQRMRTKLTVTPQSRTPTY
ncbi:MAG TPA: serine/threonine-protein kinase [Pyrinomonadaceae bacterium]|nr:serine/threonine-protein kinase [Pyrinomonadaceae bacterium]